MRLSRASVMLRATWYEGTAQLLSLTELKSPLFEIYFIGLTIKPMNNSYQLTAAPADGYRLAQGHAVAVLQISQNPLAQQVDEACDNLGVLDLDQGQQLLGDLGHFRVADRVTGIL